MALGAAARALGEELGVVMPTGGDGMGRGSGSASGGSGSGGGGKKSGASAGASTAAATKLRVVEKSKIVATYQYTDAAGVLLYEVVRMDPKSFRQRRKPRPDDPPEKIKSGWVWNLDGVERGLYRLPAVIAADTVYVAEGEKDADALAAWGLAATTNSGGAGKFTPAMAQHLKGKNVVILPDFDESGQKHTLKVAEMCWFTGAKSIKVVELPGLPDKGDVSDWIQAGGDAAGLAKLVEQAAEWKPKGGEDGEGEAGSGDSPLTDLGNAERLKARFGDDFRYVPNYGKFIIWNSCRWEVDETGAMFRLAGC